MQRLELTWLEKQQRLTKSLALAREFSALHPNFYNAGLTWIAENPGPGGPPRKVDKVSGWRVVRMLAAMAKREVSEVAKDLIKHDLSR